MRNCSDNMQMRQCTNQLARLCKDGTEIGIATCQRYETMEVNWQYDARWRIFAFVHPLATFPSTCCLFVCVLSDAIAIIDSRTARQCRKQCHCRGEEDIRWKSLCQKAVLAYLTWHTLASQVSRSPGALKQKLVCLKLTKIYQKVLLEEAHLEKRKKRILNRKNAALLPPKTASTESAEDECDDKRSACHWLVTACRDASLSADLGLPRWTASVH